MSPQSVSSERGTSVASPDCCLRKERRSESGTMQRTVPVKLDCALTAVRSVALEPAVVTSRQAPAPERRGSREVPLYTLHSILLI
jgi:hypothetical protein